MTYPAKHQDWLAFAHRWVQVNALSFDPDGEDAGGKKEQLHSIRSRLEQLLEGKVAGVGWHSA